MTDLHTEKKVNAAHDEALIAHAWLMEVIAAARQARRSVNEGRYEDAVDRTLAASNAAGAALRVILSLPQRA